MKKVLPLILVIVLINGCFTSTINVAQGVHKGTTETYTQWYVLWGIVPMGKAGSGIQLKDEITDARVYTEFSAWDSLFNIFVGPFTSVGRNTVTIEK